jgi:cyclase
MHHTLIVARLQPGHHDEVAAVFAESDQTALPHLVGVRGRSLFAFHDLYFHLIESEVDPREALGSVRDHPLFVDVNTKLQPHIRPYDPGWRRPEDAMARQFYRWPAGRET